MMLLPYFPNAEIYRVKHSPPILKFSKVLKNTNTLSLKYTLPPRQWPDLHLYHLCALRGAT